MSPVPPSRDTGNQPYRGQKTQGYLLHVLAGSKGYNKARRELYERMLATGKAKKVALVAVMNELLKQVFGVVHSGIVYTPTFSAKCLSQHLKGSRMRLLFNTVHNCDYEALAGQSFSS